MAEEPTTTQTPEPPKEPKPEPPAENLIGEAKRKQQAAEKEAADLRAKVEALEQKDATELEKAVKRAEKAEGQVNELTGKVTKLEKGALVEKAAREARFHDPSDATAYIDLAGIEDEAGAKQAVEDLAKSKAHLIAPEGETQQIGRVGKTPPKEPEIPVGEDGQPDYKAGLAGELAGNLLGPRP